MDSGRQQSQPAPRFPLTVTLCPTHGQSQSSEWPDRGLVLVTDSGGEGACWARTRLLLCLPVPAGIRANPLQCVVSSPPDTGTRLSPGRAGAGSRARAGGAGAARECGGCGLSRTQGHCLGYSVWPLLGAF